MALMKVKLSDVNRVTLTGRSPGASPSPARLWVDCKTSCEQVGQELHFIKHFGEKSVAPVPLIPASQLALTFIGLANGGDGDIAKFAATHGSLGCCDVHALPWELDQHTCEPRTWASDSNNVGHAESLVTWRSLAVTFESILRMGSRLMRGRAPLVTDVRKVERDFAVYVLHDWLIPHEPMKTSTVPALQRQQIDWILSFWLEEGVYCYQTHSDETGKFELRQAARTITGHVALGVSLILSKEGGADVCDNGGCGAQYIRHSFSNPKGYCPRCRAINLGRNAQRRRRAAEKARMTHAPVPTTHDLGSAELTGPT
jgi:hypothetical protein